MTERTDAQVNLIYKHTHNDFKSIIDGVKFVTYPAPLSGIGPVESLPDKIFADKLRYAEHRQKVADAYKALKPVMVKYDILGHFEATQQWRESLDSVVEYASWALKAERLSDFKTDIEKANISFPGNYRF